MNSVGDFFGKFKNLAIVEFRKRDVIIEAIKQTTNQTVDFKDISIKDGVISIKSSSALKSEIFLKKNKILSLIKEKLPDLKVTDIK
jgi:hypothetical protein